MRLSLVFLNGPSFIDFEADITGHRLGVRILLMLGQIGLTASRIVAQAARMPDAQMPRFHVTFKRVSPRGSEMTVITGNTFLARLVPVQPVLLQVFGGHCLVVTMLT